MHIHIYMYLYIYRICTSCIEREANVYADVHISCLTYTSAHAWCSTTPVNACWLSTKMHMDSCMCAYATVQQLLCHGSYCELILSLARTSCRLSFTARHPTARGRARPPPPTRPPASLLLPSCRQSVARRCSLQKSVQIHASSWRGRRCGVAQASSDHPRWCRPHPVCLWVALALGQRRLPVTEMRFRHFRAGYCYTYCLHLRVQWVGIVPESGKWRVIIRWHMFNKTDMTFQQVNLGMVAYLGSV